MEEVNVKEIKSWREKLGLSQKKLSELAKISLNTIRQLEIGKHKPQQRTLKRLSEALNHYLEKDTTGEKADAKPKAPVAAGTAVKKEEKKVPKKRGRKPKSYMSATESAPTTHASERSGSIKLSNLDLELINRIFSMTNEEKLDLLRRIM